MDNTEIKVEPLEPEEITIHPSGNYLPVKKEEPFMENYKKSCSICFRKFATNLRLQNHMHLHNSPMNVFKCKQCPSVFPTKCSLYIHMSSSIHSKRKKFLCGICLSRFSNKLYLIRHKKNHVKCGKSKCDFCNRRFASPTKRLLHLRQNGCPKLTCFYCRRSFTSIYHFRLHKRSCVSSQSPPACPQCGITFKRLPLLRVHLRNICNGTPSIKCPYCDKIFSTHVANLSHQMRKHQDKMLHCNTCDFFTHRPRYLKAHQKKHKEGEDINRKLKCDYCDKTCRHKKNMEKHINKTHCTVQWNCSMCDHIFSNEYFFILHLKTHKLLLDDSPGLLGLLN